MWEGASSCPVSSYVRVKSVQSSMWMQSFSQEYFMYSVLCVVWNWSQNINSKFVALFHRTLCVLEIWPNYFWQLIDVLNQFFVHLSIICYNPSSTRSILLNKISPKKKTQTHTENIEEKSQRRKETRILHDFQTLNVFDDEIYWWCWELTVWCTQFIFVFEIGGERSNFRYESL